MRRLGIVNQALTDTGNQRPNPTVTADTSDARNKTDYMISLLERLNGMHPRPVITTETGQVTAAISYVMGLLNDVNGRVATAYINTIVRTFDDPNHIALGPGGRGGTTIGGRKGWLSDSKFQPEIVRRYATGGISYESPGTAKIYKPASQYRIFAEPETGGEAYIPLSVSKRSRSLAIWEETGRRLGAQRYADGGISGGVSSGPQVAVSIDSYVQQTDSTVDDVARALMRQIKSRGVNTMEVI
jgi:hypothetical protein